MARRRPGCSGIGMASLVVLLLAVAVVLSSFPSSAVASSTPAESESAGGGGGEQQQAPPPDDDDGDGGNKEEEQEETDPEAQKQAAKEKAVAEEKAVQQELLKYAKEKGLVSPTNGTGWYKGIGREFLSAHNALRQRYGVTPMKWDKKLARQARRWSNAMRKDCQMLHSGRETGQSVFRSHDDWNATATDAVNMWAEEEAIYDKDREKCLFGKVFKECGHFALIVGKRSTKLGCARAECFKGGVFITCNYYASDLKDKDKDKDKDKTKSSSTKQQQSSSKSPPPPPTDD